MGYRMYTASTKQRGEIVGGLLYVFIRRRNIAEISMAVGARSSSRHQTSNGIHPFIALKLLLHDYEEANL